ncbi:MAG: ankyrin repeat domain-containing protein [Treponema sp.]|nr:ankyrin repeat domain-containing protein [Treponema sp.]
MNWLIIVSNPNDENAQLVQDFLSGKFGAESSKVLLYPNISREELFDICNKVLVSSHFIILDSERLHKLPDYNFILGLIRGRQCPAFIFEGRPYIRRYESLEKELRGSSYFTCFSHLNELTNLIEKNFEKYRRDDEQKNALASLFANGIPFTSDCFAQYIAKDNTEICETFFKAGMLMNARTSNGIPLLCIATRNDCISKVKWLLENGADIDAISSDRGYSPVMDAVWRKNFDITKYLISKGADLSFVSSDGQPILVLAVGNGNVDIVKILLENGADPDIKDSMGMSAREYALLFKKKPMIELMEKFPKK